MVTKAHLKDRRPKTGKTDLKICKNTSKVERRHPVLREIENRNSKRVFFFYKICLRNEMRKLIVRKNFKTDFDCLRMNR